MKILAAVCGAAILALIIARRMWEQPIWYGDGWAHFLSFAAAYALASTVLIRFRPRWYPALLLALVLAVTISAIGIVPVLATFYILASCLALGRLIRQRAPIPESLLLGLACCMLAVQVLVHFPVNFPVVYGILLALPLIWNWRALLALRIPLEGSAAMAVGLFPLLCQWVVVLKPETGPDALSMHLANPLSIAYLHRGSFDVRHMIRAVMPMGGDWVYTVGVLLGGDFAARLLNLAMLGLLAVLLFRASRRWLDHAQAWLLVGLFGSLPVVQMVTGSLFVENIWAVFLLAAYLSLDDALLCGVFAGAAVMTKLLAAAFALPILFCKRPKLAALAVAGLWALPPYIEAYARTGNPVFPYMNTVFRSPFYDTKTPFVDDRLNEKLNPAVLYHLTFDTHKYVEGQDGAFGFQMLLFLPLVMVLAAVKRPFPEWRTLTVVLLSSLLILSATPHMRYLYPAMALSTLLFALLLAELGRTGVVLCLACTALNLCFLPAASWIHKDFAWNPFDRAAAERFLTAGAPTRELIDLLNEKHPGQPVLFLETLEVAGLRATEFSNSWHHASFLKQLGEADYPQGLARLFAANGINYFVAPLHIPVRQIAVGQYLRANAVQEWQNGNYAVYALRDGPPQTAVAGDLAEGTHDDADPAILYSGGWERDVQFAEARGHTVSYSNLPGASARFRFHGRELIYTYTKAANRGRAEVLIDGVSRGIIAMKSAAVQWQQETTFAGLGVGWHDAEIRVLEGYVDVDALVSK